MLFRSLPFYKESADQDFIKATREAVHGRSVLFHGTSLGSQIARTDTLLVPSVGDPMVSFTRSPEIAVHFATLPKDFDDGLPTVFMFDRRSLKSRFRLEPHEDEADDEQRVGKFEMEERVWDRDIRPISRHLIAIVFGLGGRIYTLTTKREFRNFFVPIASCCASGCIGIRSNGFR
jgi:hypothetical protein